MRTIDADPAPRSFLVVAFCVWKALLLTIAILSPGLGYDTSTQLLFDGYRSSHLTLPGAQPNRGTTTVVETLVERLTRWDAIYFTSIADRGYVLEQEWAFGWGFTNFLSFLHASCPLHESKPYSVMMYGIVLANVCHGLSVFVLYHLAIVLLPVTHKHRAALAFIAACMHIIAPAGIFLFAPYTEAPFSLLNFLGHLCYAYSWNGRSFTNYGLAHDTALVVAGLCCGLAATVRGNGLLSGLLLFSDLIGWIIGYAEQMFNVQLFSSTQARKQLGNINFRRIPATIVSGLLVAAGFLTPQYLAYQKFCGEGATEKRPWCTRIPPSIYSWVQEHYWGVGLFRYWTLSNLPLFFIASPVLYIMISSAWQALHGQTTISLNSNRTGKAKGAQAPNDVNITESLLFRLALPQFALACAALTTFHVQVITRLSSGYPLWYLVLAQHIIDNKWQAKWLVKWCTMYSLIQAVLFLNFLPPA